MVGAQASDGRGVVLGGLIKDDVQMAEQRVPILGDIPLLGRLFRSDSESVTKNNLLVFIRSTIIRDDAQLDGATAMKYRHIREEQLMRKERGMQFIDDEYLPVLPEWEREAEALRLLREAEAVQETGEQ